MFRIIIIILVRIRGCGRVLDECPLYLQEHTFVATIVGIMHLLVQ